MSVERPIIFGSEMVSVISGCKTQTRRLIKPSNEDGPVIGPLVNHTGEPAVGFVETEHNEGVCRYGMPGDLLWVQEVWRPVMYPWTCEIEYRGLTRPEEGRYDSKIVTDGRLLDSLGKAALRFSGRKPEHHSEEWRAAVDMPRWASRITLRVTDVRVQRLQDITDTDAVAEGVSSGRIPADEDGPERIGYVLGPDDGKCILYPTKRDAFLVGWDGINGKRGPWVTNCWVWVLSFERLS